MFHLEKASVLEMVLTAANMTVREKFPGYFTATTLFSKGRHGGAVTSHAVTVTCSDSAVTYGQSRPISRFHLLRK